MQPRPVGQSFFYDIRRDMFMILAYENRPANLKNYLWIWLACDAFAILVSFRLRKLLRRWRVPFLNRLIRLWQTAFYAIELGIDIELGHGVYFVHSVGTVVGGDAKIGEGCVFFGNNTIGAARFRGSPVIGAHTVIGAGVRILGTIQVGPYCFLGANAVVVDNIEEGKVAVGIPARVIADNDMIPANRSTEDVERVI
ncbi:serine O-acetyltransferase EpsC [Oligoflexus tunisiensis]|uniref:serine O-acetyltransferase EpsC n=1 Tax=Oligoflexus tunisiensis TaxID=708132 RepID=UPI00114CE6FF|nr:serine O-acetyltransferase EpsC [Oligoflexus tunisiensis]